MEEFLNNLKLSNFSSEEIEYILQSGKTVFYKKGETFSYRGKKSDKAAILQKGIFGGYQLNDKDEKRMLQFYILPYNYVVVDYKCFVQDVVCEQTIEALDDSLVLEIDMNTVKILQEKFPNFLAFEKILAQKKYVESQNLINMFQTANAKQKIAIIQEKAPELMAKVPYSYIASFLGLHRNTFAEALKKI